MRNNKAGVYPQSYFERSTGETRYYFSTYTVSVQLSKNKILQVKQYFSVSGEKYDMVKFYNLFVSSQRTIM